MSGDWRDVADRLIAEQDAGQDAEREPEHAPQSLFGRPEAALLLAIERANGGEFAPLGQVLVAHGQLFRSAVDPEVLALSCALLIDASLVEWGDGAFALLPKGRKLIRRSGSHWAADFPDRVAARLSEIDEATLLPEGETPVPTVDDVRAAMPGRAAVRGADGGAGSPVPTIGMQPGLRVTYERAWTGESLPTVPLVPTVTPPSDPAGHD